MRQEIQMLWAWTLFANLYFQCMCADVSLSLLPCKCTIAHMFPPWRYVHLFATREIFTISGAIEIWYVTRPCAYVVHTFCIAPTYFTCSALLHIRVFLKGHFVKKKMFTPPRNWGVPRKIISRRRGWSNKSRGSALTLKVWQNWRRWRRRRQNQRRQWIFVIKVLPLVF